MGTNPFQEFLLEIDYANPKFGNWGPYAWLNAPAVAYFAVPGDYSTQVDRSDIFTQSWRSGSFDYYDIFSLVRAVPEPPALSLLSVALIALAGCVSPPRNRAIAAADNHRPDLLLLPRRGIPGVRRHGARRGRARPHGILVGVRQEVVVVKSRSLRRARGERQSSQGGCHP